MDVFNISLELGCVLKQFLVQLVRVWSVMSLAMTVGTQGDASPRPVAAIHAQNVVNIQKA
ncbi:TPA: hypothetical protein L6B28_00795 [Pseudomonas aeruginosa]|nr:hypothetical protein IPC991_22750 [Pseudomonas aeruginosa]HBP6799870.1 hypothetical protein [Pseudomonas aeruginosa]